MTIHHWAGMKQVKKSGHGIMFICSWVGNSKPVSYRPNDPTLSANKFHGLVDNTALGARMPVT
jgi:hypothetical protein